MLGLCPDAINRRLLVVRPKLPFWLSNVHINGMQIAGGEVDLHFYRQRGRTALAADTRGDVSVVLTSSWRRFERSETPARSYSSRTRRVSIR
jgi:hypothetical protein